MATLLTPQDSVNMAQAQWQEMAGGQWSNGVLAGQLNAYVTTTTSGLGISVASGKALIQGFLARSDAAVALTAAAADPTNPRIDRAVLHADLSAHTLTVQLLTGTPAPSPTPPALTQTSTVWEISLYQVRVNAASSTITSLTDERPFAAPNIPNGGISGAMLASGALPAGVTIPAGQVTAGTLPGGVNVPAANVQAGTFPSGAFTFASTLGIANGATFFDASGFLHFPTTGAFRGATYFNGTGTGTFAHAFVGTPNYVGVMDNTVGSQTMGVDTIGGTTCHVTAGASHAWLGAAMG